MSVEETEREGLFTEQTVSLPADDTMQWRAALMQLVNWGGFGGLTTVPLRGEATMISGASGVGKSTILDAYTALMMPSDTKFNGASNDAVAGRARGVGQRNLLSYLRGAVDVVDDPRTGRPVEKLLRGKGGDTWGAVAMTFVNDQGGRFTALRTYYVPRRASRSADVQMQLVTHEGALSLQVLEAAVAEAGDQALPVPGLADVQVRPVGDGLAEDGRRGLPGGGDDRDDDPRSPGEPVADVAELGGLAHDVGEEADEVLQLAGPVVHQGQLVVVEQLGRSSTMSL